MRKRSRWWIERIGIVALLTGSVAWAAPGPAVSELKRLSIEDLMNVEVTSVSKSAQPLAAAPAAIFVITADDIQHSGATSIPELLRLAPNLQVVQLSSSNYTVTARGFSGNSNAQNFSNKLLVLIDGRTVYSPLFSGVYWDSQDLMPEDIERIEVISGPGAALWGANAVNGVINIITRPAGETRGGVASVDLGDFEKGAAFRWGGKLGDAADYRVYLKGFERDELELDDGSNAGDGWNSVQGGFRSDWQRGADVFTLQGDGYRGRQDQLAAPDSQMNGANLSMHWQRALSDTSSLSVQAYYDRVERHAGANAGFDMDTYDITLQHSFSIGERNAIVWGAGHRLNRLAVTNTATFLFLPADRSLNLSNIFAQDIIDVGGGVDLTLGLKLEDSALGGTTSLPNVRLSWKPRDSQLVWAAASRAIRAATPFDHDVKEYLPGNILFLEGGVDFKPEKVTAYELGYRGEFAAATSLSASVYFNEYDDLRSIEFSPITLFPLYFANQMHGETWGVELWANYQARDWWRLALGYALQREDLRFRPGSSGLLGIQAAWNEPDQKASLRSTFNLPGAVTVDADVRYVDALPDPAVPAYTELNLRAAWRISAAWEVALTGSNLLHRRHLEFTLPPSDWIARTVQLRTTLRF